MAHTANAWLVPRIIAPGNCMFRATEINRNLLAFNCFLRLNIIINNNYFEEHDFEQRARGTFEGLVIERLLSCVRQIKSTSFDNGHPRPPDLPVTVSWGRTCAGSQMPIYLFRAAEFAHIPPHILELPKSSNAKNPWQKPLIQVSITVMGGKFASTKLPTGGVRFEHYSSPRCRQNYYNARWPKTNSNLPHSHFARNVRIFIFQVIFLLLDRVSVQHIAVLYVE